MSDNKKINQPSARPYREGEDFLRYLWEVNPAHPFLKAFFEIVAASNRERDLTPPHLRSPALPEDPEARRVMLAQMIRNLNLTMK